MVHDCRLIVAYREEAGVSKDRRVAFTHPAADTEHVTPPGNPMILQRLARVGIMKLYSLGGE